MKLYANLVLRMWAVFMALLLTETQLCAGLPMFFNLDGCAGYSKVIARGYLSASGNFIPHDIFKGVLPTNALAITDGANLYQKLAESMRNEPQPATNSIEVVAFLSGQSKDEWTVVDSFTGMVGLAGTNVFLFGHGKGGMFKGRAAVADRDEFYNQEVFLAALKNHVRFEREADTLLALSNPVERFQKLLAFLLEHQTWYFTRHITESLRPLDTRDQQINPDWQKELLKQIFSTDKDVNKCFLLRVADQLRLSKDAFDPIEQLTHTSNPPSVRKAAICSLLYIDRERITSLALRKLRLTEPDLTDYLNVLAWDNPAIDSKIADALFALSQELRLAENRNPRPASFNDEEAIRQKLARHVQPRFLKFYFDWLLQNQPICPAYVASDLQSMLGVRWDITELLEWWVKNREKVLADYPLQTEAGRKQWFVAYTEGDDILRRFLVRLWAITPATNQVALVKMATKNSTAKLAKCVIAELWKGERLGNEAIQAMFENFMRVKFVDAVDKKSNRSKYQHQLTIILEFDYPFHTCFYYRPHIALDGKISGDDEGQLCPEPDLKEYSLGCIGGYVPSQIATGTFEVYQREYYPDGKKLWRAHWDLGRIPLGE